MTNGDKTPCSLCKGVGSVPVAKAVKDAAGKVMGQTTEYRPCPQCRGKGVGSYATK